jgi:methionyl-tRNA formyltransferase
VRLVFLGSGEFAVPTLRWLIQAGHEVALVVSQPARGSGRGRKLTPTPTAQAASELGLPRLEVENVNDPEVVARLWACEARVGLVIAFGQKLGDGVMRAFPCGCVNLHASLLPRLRGAAPIQWAIARGEVETGVTVFRIVERMDAGPILAVCATPVGADENAGQLHDRLAELGVQAVERTLASLEAENPPGAPQIEAAASLARKLVKADGFVHFDRSVSDISRHVRAMTPWPGANAKFEAQDGRWENVSLIRVRRAEALAGKLQAAPTEGTSLNPALVRGEVTTASKPPLALNRIAPGTLDDELLVAAADGRVEIVELRPSSGRAMPWNDYLNGRRVSPGDRFTVPD